MAANVVYFVLSNSVSVCMCLQVAALYLNHSVFEQARSARREGQKWQVEDRRLFSGVRHVHDRSLVYSHELYFTFFLSLITPTSSMPKTFSGMKKICM